MNAAGVVRLFEGCQDAFPHVDSKLLGGAAKGGRLAEENALVGDAGFHRREIAALGRRHPLAGAVYPCAGLTVIRGSEEKPGSQAEGHRKGYSSPDAQHKEYVRW